ncbi:hypothetical protein GCM10025762_12740 [Haloechinothrix salitolerans]
MHGQCSNERPYYRCGFLTEYRLANRAPHPRNVYLAEADVLPKFDRWLSGLKSGERPREPTWTARQRQSR